MHKTPHIATSSTVNKKVNTLYPITIQLETKSDETAIAALINECFGPDRKERTVYQFRKNIEAYKNLCLTARDTQGTLCGSLRFWPVLLPDGQEIPLFGPLAVNPAKQNMGIGRKLIQAGHELAQEKDYPALLIIGRPEYYGPFGYTTNVVKNITLPGPVHPLTFMGLEFQPNILRQQNGPLKPCK